MAKGSDVNEVVLKALEKKDKDAVCVVTLYYGEGVEKRSAEKLQKEVSKMFPDSDVMLCDGGQPHYSYFISLE